VSRIILFPWLPLHKNHFIALPVSLAKHFASHIIRKCHLWSASSHIISPQLLSSYYLQSRIIQVLPLSVALCIWKRVKVSYPKQNLRNATLNFITNAIIYWNICGFHCLVFNTVPLAMIKILASGQVAAWGFQTYCFQARNSNARMMSFTSVTDWLTDCPTDLTK